MNLNKLRLILNNNKWVMVLIIMVMVGGMSWYAKLRHSAPINEEAKPVDTARKVTIDDITLEAIDGYATYYITYVDKNGNRLQMSHETQFISMDNKVYTLEQAKNENLVKDVVATKDYLQLKIKIGTRYVYKASPDKTLAKEGFMVSLTPQSDEDKKVVVYRFVVGFSNDKSLPELDKSVK